MYNIVLDIKLNFHKNFDLRHCIVEWSEKIKVGNFKWQGVESVPNMNIKYRNFFQNF